MPAPSKSSTTARGKAKVPGKSKPQKSVKRNEDSAGGQFIMPLDIEKETHYPLMNLDGNLLAGVLHEPVRPTQTLVIAVHGWISSKENMIIRQASIDLCRAGYAVYRVDISGNGDSEGRFEDCTPSKELRDIGATVQHFRNRYANIVLLGHSLGGMLSVIAASRIKVEGVIDICAPMHPEHFDRMLTPQQYEEIISVGFTVITKRRPYGDVPYTITERFLTEMKQLAPLEAARDIHCPVLIIHGTADGTVPLSHSEELLSRLFIKDIAIIGGADHKFSNPAHLDALIDAAISWLGKSRRA